MQPCILARARDVADAMAYLHSRNVAHGDLKVTHNHSEPACVMVVAVQSPHLHCYIPVAMMWELNKNGRVPDCAVFTAAPSDFIVFFVTVLHTSVLLCIGYNILLTSQCQHSMGLD